MCKSISKARGGAEEVGEPRQSTASAKLPPQKKGIKPKAARPSKALRDLIAAGVLEPGRGVLSLIGRIGSVAADLTAEGLIVYKGNTFTSPTRFAKTVLELGWLPNGWKRTLYKVSSDPTEEWITLDRLRARCVWRGPGVHVQCVCACVCAVYVYAYICVY